MNNTQNPAPGGQRPDYSDEISLVDLVTTFIRRRRVFYVVFVAVVLAGLAYALWVEDKHDYVSVIQIAQENSGAFVQSPEATIATLENRWLPEVQAVNRAKHDRKLPFEVSFNNPESTGFIRFSSNATKEEAKAIEAAHSALISSVKGHQGELIKKERLNMKRQIASLENALEALRDEKDAGEAIASIIEKRSKLEGDMEGFQEVEVLVTSRQSAGKTAPKRNLIIVLAILLGGMFGVFVAFMTEFAGLVREQLATESAG